MNRFRFRVTASLLVVFALVVVGCGKSEESGEKGEKAAEKSEKGGMKTTALGRKLPKSIQDAGEIKVCSDIAYPPIEFYKEGTKDVLGVDPDLAKAMGKELGVEFRFENTAFDGIIPALKSKRCDVIMSSMSDTKERQDQGLDFVDYFNAGTSIIVQKGNPQKIAGLDDLCGKTIGIQKGTTQEEVATKQAAKCKSEGKGDLAVQTFEKDTEALQQLKIGRTVADMNDFPVAAYTAKQQPEAYEVVGEQIEAGPYGIGIRKDDTELMTALHEAMTKIFDNGEYEKVLKEWNVEAGAVDGIKMNGG